MMRFKSKNLAIVITFCMIIGSICFGGISHIQAQQKVIERVYNEQLRSELEEQAIFAARLISQTRNYTIDKMCVDDLQNDLDIFHNANDASSQYKALMNLYQSFTAVKIKMAEVISEGEDERVFTKTYQGFYSSYELIRRQSNYYNEVVEHYNKEINAFPLVVFKQIMQERDAVLFA